MKKIPLFKGTQVDSKSVFSAVCEQAPQGATIGEVRRRVRLLDKIEGAADVLELEDADFDLLKSLFAGFKFAKAHADLVQIADTLDSAADVKTPKGPK